MTQTLCLWVACLVMAGLLAIISLPLGANAAAPGSDHQSTVLWVVDPVPPAFYIHGGELSGYGVDAIAWFADRMDHQVDVRATPRGRAFDEVRRANLSEAQTVCIPGVLETPQRARDFLISDTVFSQLPVSVIIKEDRKSEFDAYLNDDGEIDLARLAADDHFFATLELGRSYGTEVDEIIGAQRFADHIQRTRQSADLVRMLDLHRIDWFIAYPVEAEYQRTVSKSTGMIMSLPIAGMPIMLESKLACSTNHGGRHLIEHINEIIAETPHMPWTKGYIELLSPADAIRYQSLIDKRARSQ